MKKITYKKCPYCNSDNIEVTEAKFFSESRLKYYYTCKDCNRKHIKRFSNKPFSIKPEGINRRFYLDSVEIEMEEFEEKKPRIDWSKLPVDTLIEVKDYEGKWLKRYFKEYINGIVYCWDGGATSRTAHNEYDVHGWDYARLLEE